ncbi:MAG: ABC transporter substrate-binding protein [Actinomycetota bacterium]|nr:ABC transporter substrate-binding protein [Actinomycetota bacterium]
MVFSPAVPREQRLTRLRAGEVDVALIDLASFVDTVATEPDFGARCVFVLTQRLPMAALFIRGRSAGGRPIESPADLLRARYGGTEDSRFAAEHRALLRRLGGADHDLRVEVSYERMFVALAGGDIDVAPDFGAIATRYQRAAGDGRQVGVLRYRDCGVRAYGIGFVASAAGLAGRRGEIAAFLQVAAQAYEQMRQRPDAVLASAAPLLALDREYALAEWRDEDAAAIFGFDAARAGIGAWRPELWADTVAWRREVAGFHAEPSAGQLTASVS